jgi:hypothetical protein
MLLDVLSDDDADPIAVIPTAIGDGRAGLQISMTPYQTQVLSPFLSPPS